MCKCQRYDTHILRQIIQYWPILLGPISLAKINQHWITLTYLYAVCLFFSPLSMKVVNNNTHTLLTELVVYEHQTSNHYLFVQTETRTKRKHTVNRTELSCLNCIKSLNILTIKPLLGPVIV